MATMDLTDSDLRRDEARISFILTGGPPPEVYPDAGRRRGGLGLGVAAVAVAMAAVAGVAWHRAERASEPVPAGRSSTLPIPRPVRPAVAPAPAVPPVAGPGIQPPAPVPLPVGAPPAGVPATMPDVPADAGRVAHRRTRSEPARRRAEPARRPASDRAPEPPAAAPAGSRWIADPLYGEALRRAQAADARRAAELNRAELSHLPPPG